MRRLILILALLVPSTLLGQSTTVSGNVTEVGGQVWSSGTVVATFVKPQGSNAPPIWSGGLFNPNLAITASINSSGNYTMSIPSNTSIVPSLSKWTFTANSGTTSLITQTFTVTVTGGSQTLNFTPPKINIAAGINAVAYIDSEVSATIGQTYYALIAGALRICTAPANGPCTTWANAAASGGGVPCVTLAGSLQFNSAGAFGCTSLVFTPASSLCPNGLTSCDFYQFPTTNVCIGGVWAADANISVGNEAFICNSGGAGIGALVVVNSQGRTTGGTDVAIDGTSYPRGANNEANGGRFGAGDDPLETLAGQKFYGVRSGISLTRASGSISTVEFFTAGLGEFGNSAYVNDIAGSAAAAETVGTAYGLHVLDLEGRGTTRTAAIQIDAQTNCGAAPCYAIKVDGGGVDFTNAPFFTPPTGWFQTDNIANTNPNGLNFKDSTNTPAVGRINVQNNGTNVEMFDIANIDATPGARVATITETTPLAGDIVSYNGSGVKVNKTPGVPGRVVTNSGTLAGADLVVCTSGTGDRGSTIIFTNAAAVTETLPNPASGACGGNFYVRLYWQGAAGGTLKATTATVNGIAGATGIPILGNTWVDAISHDNVNYDVYFARGIKCGTNCTEVLNADQTVTFNMPAPGTSGVPYGVGAGSVNVMTVTTSPAVATNAAGTIVAVLPNLANTTTTPTLNVGGAGAQTIKKGGSGSALIAVAANDYNVAQIAYFVSDGTVWQLINPQTGQFGNDMFIDTTGDIQGNAASTGRIGNTNSLLNATIQTVTAPTAFKGISYTSTTTSGNATFQSGIDGSLAGSQIGTETSRGGDNTSTTANSGGGIGKARGGNASGSTANTGLLGGEYDINGGDVTLGTSTTDRAGAVKITGGQCVSVASASLCPGQITLDQPSFSTGTATANDLACVTAANTVASCSGTGNGSFVGVIDSSVTNSVLVTALGAGGTHTFNAASATFTNGHFVCQSAVAASANLVVDSATICTAGFGIGIYIGATGTQTAPLVLMRPY